MEKLNWILTLGMDTVKILIFSYGVMGFEIKKEKGKYISFLYLIIGIPLIWYASLESSVYGNIWEIIFVFTFIKGNIRQKIQCFFLQIIAITLVDIAVMGIFINIIPNNWEQYTFLKEICEATAIILWLVAAIILRKARKKIQSYLKTLSTGYIVLMVLELSCMCILVACIQGIILNEMTEKIQRRALIFCVTAVLLNFLFCFLFMRMFYNKNRMELENEMAQKQMELQQKYYEKMMRQDEGMRKFRHDIRNMLQALEILKNSNDIEGLKRYIENIHGNYQENVILKTGNVMADYFISGVLEELQETGGVDFRMVGSFPLEIRMDTSDWCVLIANAMDNAKEALAEMKNERKLYIEVKHMGQGMWLRISNSAAEKEQPLLETAKKNKREHGYGTTNMRHAVEKYNGKIEFKYENGMFHVEVCLP